MYGHYGLSLNIENIYALAASHGLEGFKVLESSSQMAGHSSSLRPNLNAFLRKMDADDQTTAHRYLEIFGLSELINESL